jgi:oligopeptide transport system permease protein
MIEREELNNDFVFVQKDTLNIDSVDEKKSVGFFKDAMIRLMRNKASACAMVIILVIGLMSIFGPSLSKYGYNEQDVTRTNLPPKIPILEKFHIADGTMILYNKAESNVTNTSKFPDGSVVKIIKRYQNNGVSMVDVKVDMYKYSKVEEDVYFICGTDYLGRDLFTRLWRGARVSLIIAVLSVMVNVSIGLIYGSIAGFYGGKVDMVLMRIVEIISAFPQVIVATMLILFLGTGIKAIIIALIIRGWIATAKMIRGQFFRFKEREYVLAAKTLGVSDFKLIFRHIMPNSIGPIITKAMLEIPSAIFSEAFLAFIGLGVQAPEPSIGVLLSDAQKVLITYPYQMLFPAVLISVLMICFNLFGNGLRDAFDPTMRGLE